MHVICVKLFKMADGSEDREATFQFIGDYNSMKEFVIEFF